MSSCSCPWVPGAIRDPQVPPVLFMHSCRSTQAPSPRSCTHTCMHIWTHSYVRARRGWCPQVCPCTPHQHARCHSQGCPSQARPSGGRLHSRGMQTAGDALPADVRERPRGNHTGRNPGRRSRPRWSPRVSGSAGGHVQTLTCSSLLSHHPMSSASRTWRPKGCTDHRSPSKTASQLYLHSLAAWQSTGSLGCSGLVSAGRDHSWHRVFLPHWGRIYDHRSIYGENL